MTTPNDARRSDETAEERWPARRDSVMRRAQKVIDSFHPSGTNVPYPYRRVDMSQVASDFGALVNEVKSQFAALAERDAEIERLRAVVQEHKRVTDRATTRATRNWHRAEKARAHIAELEAVVGRLPKTADGVPVVPGMELWSSSRLGYSTLSDYAVDPSEWYSTESAVRAAAEEPDCSKCPNCGGPADNGSSRDVPPEPYYCTKCAAAEAE